MSDIDEALEALDWLENICLRPCDNCGEHPLNQDEDTRVLVLKNQIRQALERQRELEARIQRALDHRTATSELHTSWEQCADSMAACLREPVPGGRDD